MKFSSQEVSTLNSLLNQRKPRSETGRMAKWGLQIALNNPKLASEKAIRELRRMLAAA